MYEDAWGKKKKLLAVDFWLFLDQHLGGGGEILLLPFHLFSKLIKHLRQYCSTALSKYFQIGIVFLREYLGATEVQNAKVKQ